MAMSKAGVTRDIKLVDIGNSREIRLPKALLQKYGWSEFLINAVASTRNSSATSSSPRANASAAASSLSSTATILARISGRCLPFEALAGTSDPGQRDFRRIQPARVCRAQTGCELQRRVIAIRIGENAVVELGPAFVSTVWRASILIAPLRTRLPGNASSVRTPRRAPIAPQITHRTRFAFRMSCRLGAATRPASARF